jgi:hypothetical protein
VNGKLFELRFQTFPPTPDSALSDGFRNASMTIEFHLIIKIEGAVAFGIRSSHWINQSSQVATRRLLRRAGEILFADFFLLR